MMNKALLTAIIMMGATFITAQSHAVELKQPMPRVKSPSVSKSSPTAAIIPCPSKLHGGNLSITAQYSAPSGWAAKTTPTGYSGQTLVVNLHQVMSGKMHCSYGKTSMSGSNRYTTVSKPVPAGKSCTAISGYKFSCQ